MPQSKQSRVKVYLRSKPCENFANDMIEYGTDGKTVNIYNRRPNSHQGYVNNQINDWSFKVDSILHNVSQDTVYDQVVKDITLKTLDGYNGTVLCYGQTGAGKTFTMTGATENYQQRGLIPRAIQHLFKEIQTRQDRAYTVRIGYLEIYNEQLFDLLSTIPLNTPNGPDFNQTLTIFDDRGDVFVKGLSYQLASNEEEALNLLFEGETNRSIGTHILNKESSRSHCIFTIRVESKSLTSSEEKYTLSKLNLVDLAGSERLNKTQSVGVTQKEAQYINKSLSFLEQAVIGLSDSKKNNFVQFRQCKLTHILKDSIGGNCLTCMIANIWPEARHMEETVSTLRFSSRMMNVTIEPAVNEIIDPVRMMQKLDSEVKMLRQELAMHDTLVNRRSQSYEPLSEHQLFDIENQCRRYIEGSLDEIEITNLRNIQATFVAFKRICRQTEKDVEARLREKFALIDKSDVDQINEAQKAGLMDDGSLVGETDGSNFGVGLANKDSRSSKSDLLKATKKNRSKATLKASPPPDRKPTAKGSKEPTFELQKDKKDQYLSNLNQLKETTRPSTPPSKSIAFEDFKAERGNEINRIWNENKDILTSKRRQYSDMAHRINETKALIDSTRLEVDKKRDERTAMGEFLSELGETVIDEEEFGLIKRLQDLKSRYRDDFDKWRELKAEIVYCQNLVEQCRQRLIQEFDTWYNETYFTNGQLPKNSVYSMDKYEPKYGSAAAKQYEDAVEKFERMQREIMSAHIDSVPYHAARLRNERKHVYNDSLEMASHHYLNNSQQIGTPQRRLANPPPGKLRVT